MKVAVLGPIEAERDGRRIDLGTPKRRALFSALVLHRGRVLATDTLVELLWGDDPPRTSIGTLQAYVAGLRKAIEPERAARGVPSVLVTDGPGYALALPPGTLDADRLADAVSAAGALADPLLPATASSTTTAARVDGAAVAAASQALADALATWRGTPYVELGDDPDAVAERARLDELHVTAEELRAATLMATGDLAGAVGQLDRLTRLHPLRERVWAVRALALARSGRQGDALATLREVRHRLADELGIDPGEQLRAVETAVLRQDVGGPAVVTALAAPPAPASTPRPADVLVPVPVPAPAPAPAPVEKDGDRPASRTAPAHPWPLVGRKDALAALVAALDTAAATDRPQAVALVGEPGIGKSRLCAELAARAAATGAQVLIGRCSQDDGAPPLWPWTSVLAQLGSPLDLADDSLGTPEPAGTGTSAGADDVAGRRFRSWDAICRTLLAAAEERTVVVVLDDLHWSDTSSLRVLRHLLQIADAGRLLVVTTWRPHPEPTGPLAEVAEALARRHAVRIDLPGLSEAETAALLTAVAGHEATPAQARMLRERTEGNPFFLVEYARLQQQSGPGAAAGRTADDDPPPAVSDVLGRRLAALPPECLAVVRGAAVLGRDFTLTPLAALTGRTEDATLDALDPALAAGLVLEDGVDRFRFSHALVRTAVLVGVPLSRRARWHARAAVVLEGAPEGVVARTDIARHWLAAGPAHAARAWPSAVAAAEDARRIHAEEEARELLRAAATAQATDPQVTWQSRYEVLLSLADVCRALADWDGLTLAAEEAVEIAEAAGDVECATLAAVQPGTGAPWQPRGMGVVHHALIDALRRSVERLPPGDGALRCRVLCALATELYYDDRPGTGPKERHALADEALAMARRLDSPELVLAALHTAFTATWRPSTAVDRLARTTEGVVLAETVGNEQGLAAMLTLQAVALSELGRVEEMWRALERARPLAVAVRDAYLLLVLGCLEAPWQAQSGRDAEAEATLAELARLVERTALPQGEAAALGALLVVRSYQGRWDVVPEGMESLARYSTLPLWGVTVSMLLRMGLVDAARAVYDEHGIDLEPDDWMSLLTWCTACEVAAGLGLPELGAVAYAKVAPFAGRTAIAGSGAPMGPVDAFLALGAVATGERALARRHADDAERLCETWKVPLVAQWLRDQRDRYGI